MPHAGQTVCYTSFTYAYLSRARTLAQSLRQAHPDWALHAVVVDEPPEGLDAEAALAEFDAVVPASALRLKRFRPWLFKHDVVEACTAVKGQMLVELLEAGWEKVIYLDPDIAVFHGLETVDNRLNIASIVLTPHQCEANTHPRDIADNELTSLRYGIYNLGFIAVRNDPDGRAFAAWWAAQLYRACYDDVPNGIFTDQKYCDLVPGLFGGVFVERDPGCNVASWNLSRRVLRMEGGRLLVNGRRLRFYHFTKIGGDGDTMTERYAGANVEIFEIWQWYKRRLAANTVPGIPGHYWHFGHFSNGRPIPKAARQLYRSRQDLMDHFQDPFLHGSGSFLEWLLHEAPEVFAGAPE